MKLVVHADEATEDQIEHATAAAQAVFTAAGVTAYQCAAAAFELEGEDDQDDDEQHESTLERATLWWKAREVAHRACYAGRSDAPRHVDLELIEDGEDMADAAA